MNNILSKLKTQFPGKDEPASYSDSPQIKRPPFIKKIMHLLFKSPKRSLVIIVLIGAIGVGGYYISHKQTPEEKAKQELAAAVMAVGHYMILPEGDQPVLATVTDAKTLIEQQAFFAGSINGDQLLLYPKSLKAIIWSPSRKMIVNVGPIQQSPSISADPQANLDPARNNNAVQTTTPPKTTVSVEVRNGTGKAGLAGQIAAQISANAGYSVIKTTDASIKNYNKTIIFDRVKNDNQKQLVGSLSSSLHAEPVATLPDGEKNTDADVLIILGAND